MNNYEHLMNPAYKERLEKNIGKRYNCECSIRFDDDYIIITLVSSRFAKPFRIHRLCSLENFYEPFFEDHFEQSLYNAVYYHLTQYFVYGSWT